MPINIGSIYGRAEGHGVRTELWVLEGLEPEATKDFLCLVTIFQGKRMLHSRLIPVNEYALAKLHLVGFQEVTEGQAVA